MKRFLRILSIFLILFSLSVLWSCGEKKSGDQQNGDAGATSAGELDEADGEDADLTPYLPDADYGGYEFSILMRQHNANRDFIYEEAAGEVVDDALYRRDLAVEERLGVKIVPVVKEGAGDFAVKSIKAGDDDFDLILPHANVAWSSYVANGLAFGWDGLTYVDLGKPWWNKDARESFSVGGKIYNMTGDASYMSLGFTVALAFNKNMFRDLNLEEPYQMVLDGTWTFDVFSALVKKGTKDLNGDSKIDINDGDRLGFVTTVWQAPVAFLWSCGSRTTKKDESDMPYIALNNEKTVKLFESLFALLKSEDCHAYDAGSSGNLPHVQALENEKALIVDLHIWSLAQLKNMSSEYGVVPYPKFTPDDKYASNVDAGVHTMIIPVSLKDPERTSAVLESLSAESYRTVMPAFYEIALKVKYTRDDVSVKMLDIIKESRVFDFGYFTNYNNSICMPGHVLFGQASPDFASLYEKNESAAQKALEKLVDNILNNQ